MLRRAAMSRMWTLEDTPLNSQGACDLLLFSTQCHLLGEQDSAL